MLLKEEVQPRKIRILLADDHSIVRKQLAIRLSSEPDLEIVEVASNSRETFQKAQATHPHILLIDPLMRDGLGVATLRQVRVNFPEIIIVVLTAYVDTMLKMHIQRMGVRHILTKGIVSSELVAELREAASTRSSDRL
ncbi:MAG TPA: response regulator [Anaerolineales bacterium]|nr:response regulator [Anaerolineales bacterium]